MVKRKVVLFLLVLMGFLAPVTAEAKKKQWESCRKALFAIHTSSNPSFMGWSVAKERIPVLLLEVGRECSQADFDRLNGTEVVERISRRLSEAMELSDEERTLIQEARKEGERLKLLRKKLGFGSPNFSVG